MLLTSVFLLPVLAGLGYQALGSFLDARRFPPAGRLVQGQSSRLHIHQLGSGSPVVIFEAGIASTSLAWTFVQREIGQLTTWVSYDLAGLGWSDPHRKPRTLDAMAAEFSELLTLSRLPPPYILVGHSFGGLLVRAYAVRHPEQVCGFVLVDPVAAASWANCSPEDRRRLASGVRLSKRGALLAQFGVVRAALSSLSSGARFLPKIIGRAAAGRGVICHVAPDR